METHLGYASPYGVGPLLSRAIARARDAAVREERATVAARVCALITRSGLSRAGLASAIGTSRSRLSTYASGRVVPSATLLVRMENVAADAAPEPQVGGSATDIRTR